MKKMSILLIFAFVLLTGCNDDYDIRVSNSSGAPIREVALQWGNLWPFGTIANGSDATFLFANDMEPNYLKRRLFLGLMSAVINIPKKYRCPLNRNLNDLF